MERPCPHRRVSDHLSRGRWVLSLHFGEQLVPGHAQRVVRVIAAPGQFRDLAQQDQVLASLGRDELLDGVLVAAAPGERRELRRAQRVVPRAGAGVSGCCGIRPRSWRGWRSGLPGRGP